MKSIDLRGLSAIILVLLALSSPGSAQKPRIAVLNFENNTSNSLFGDKLGQAAADEMTTQLVKSGEFSVIERREIEAVLAEQRAGQSGVIDPATAARVGKVLGAQLVIVGSITKFSIETKSAGVGRLAVSASYSEAESSIDARAIDTTTGEILLVADGAGKKRFGGAGYKDINFERDFNAGVAQEALRPAIENSVEKLLDQKDRFAGLAAAAPAGQIVGSRGADIYIDRGQNTGIKVGQRFQVERVVHTITDASGNVLDEVSEKVGVIEVTSVLSRSSVCRIVEGEAKEGDRIRPVG